MNKDQEALIKYVADALMYSVAPTKVLGEKIKISVEGLDFEPTIWSGDTTTYTLGLMLSGLLINMDSNA